jgi:hypothetical protein
MRGDQVKLVGRRCARCKRYGVAGFTVNTAAEWVCLNVEGCERRRARAKERTDTLADAGPRPSKPPTSYGKEG